MYCTQPNIHFDRCHEIKCQIRSFHRTKNNQHISQMVDIIFYREKVIIKQEEDKKKHIQ